MSEVERDLGTLKGRLKYLQDITQMPGRQISRRAGLSKTHAFQILSGRYADLSCKTASAICEIFGVTMDWLVMGKGPTPTAREVLRHVVSTSIADPEKSRKLSG